MAIRYIYNTTGDYVAFVTEGNLFSPDLNWLGVVTNGNEVYDTAGNYLGILLNDDRIVKNKERKNPSITAPQKPITPIKPIKPLKRLGMISLPYPYEDIFENKYRSAQLASPIQSMDQLLGAEIYAEDGNFLGEISRDAVNQRSIANEYGPYGSVYSKDSIFNTYSTYGSQYSVYSPYNPYSSIPPRVIKNGKVLGLLTANPYVFNRIDINEFIDWWRKTKTR